MSSPDPVATSSEHTGQQESPSRSQRTSSPSSNWFSRLRTYVFAKFHSNFSLVCFCMVLRGIGAAEIGAGNNLASTYATSFGSFENLIFFQQVPHFAQSFTKPLAGTLVISFGNRNVLLGSLFLYLVGTLLCAFARGMILFLVGRALLNLAWGVIGVLLDILVQELYPNRTGTFQAAAEAVFGIGSAGGAWLGGFLAGTKEGWRVLFYISAVAAVALEVVFYSLFQARGNDNLWTDIGTWKKWWKLDWIGMILLGIALFAELYACNLATRGVPSQDPVFWVFFALCPAFLIIFLIWERVLEYWPESQVKAQSQASSDPNAPRTVSPDVANPDTGDLSTVDIGTRHIGTGDTGTRDTGTGDTNTSNSETESTVRDIRNSPAIRRPVIAPTFIFGEISWFHLINICVVVVDLWCEEYIPIYLQGRGSSPEKTGRYMFLPFFLGSALAAPAGLWADQIKNKSDIPGLSLTKKSDKMRQRLSRLGLLFALIMVCWAFGFVFLAVIFLDISIWLFTMGILFELKFGITSLYAGALTTLMVTIIGEDPSDRAIAFSTKRGVESMFRALSAAFGSSLFQLRMLRKLEDSFPGEDDKIKDLLDHLQKLSEPPSGWEQGVKEACDYSLIGNFSNIKNLGLFRIWALIAALALTLLIVYRLSLGNIRCRRPKRRSPGASISSTRARTPSPAASSRSTRSLLREQRDGSQSRPTSALGTRPRTLRTPTPAPSTRSTRSLLHEQHDGSQSRPTSALGTRPRTARTATPAPSTRSTRSLLHEQHDGSQSRPTSASGEGSGRDNTGSGT